MSNLRGLFVSLTVMLVAAAMFVITGDTQSQAQDRTISLMPATIPAVPINTPAYQHLLAVYSNNADTIYTKWQAETKRRYNKEDVIPRKSAEKLLADGKKAEKELRAYCQSRPYVLYDGDSLIRKYLIPSSPVSAQLYLRLLNDKLLNRQALANTISDLGYDRIDPEFVTLLKELASTRDNPGWKECVIALCRAGEDTEEYRNIITDWAISNDEYADQGVDALLFHRYYATRLEAKVNEKNNILVQKLINTAPSMSERALCADYEAERGNIKLAENICSRILWIPYNTQLYEGNDNSKEDPVTLVAKEYIQSDIHHAKDLAVQTLFYKIRTASAFAQVYARTTQGEDQTLLPEIMALQCIQTLSKYKSKK